MLLHDYRLGTCYKNLKKKSYVFQERIIGKLSSKK